MPVLFCFTESVSSFVYYHCEYGIHRCCDVNPVIVSKSDMYETEEGCLSLDGVRKTTRYQEIEVEYYDFNWKK